MSNNPTNTKKAMKKTLILSIATLVVMGSIINGCTKEDNPLPEPENKVVTLTASISLGGNTKTKALTTEGVKTFAAGEQMALVYKNGSGNTVKVVSAPLEDGDIVSTGDLATDKKSAKFTFNITEVPDKTKDVTYIYPAAMAKADGTVNYDALENDQDGTWATLSSNFDFCTKTAAWDEESLPNCTLENQFAICAFDLKSGENKINEDITSMTISDGTNSYVVNRTPSSDKIYVVIRPTNSPLSITTTIGGTHYCKSSTYRPYVAGNGYVLTLKMISLTSFDLKYGSFDQDKDAYIYQTGAATESTDHTITIHAGRTVVLAGVNIDAGDVNAINCSGNATIVLSGTNTVKNTSSDKATIKAGPSETNLTFSGEGTLNATAKSSSMYGAIIGSDKNATCGNITIKGGTINALRDNSIVLYGAAIGAGGVMDSNNQCGIITISGGKVVAESSCGAGIGSGASFSSSSKESVCSGIVIEGGTVEATSGKNSTGTSPNYVFGGAAIGSGSAGNGSASGYMSGKWKSICQSISITGGTVNASSKNQGAAIGSGFAGAVSGDITISGGKTIAECSYNYNNSGTTGGAGIGCGRFGKCANITIEGGNVAARGSFHAVGIGTSDGITNNKSYKSSCGTITITADISELKATSGSSTNCGAIGYGTQYSSCTSVIFGTQTMYNGSSWEGGGDRTRIWILWWHKLGQIYGSENVYYFDFCTNARSTLIHWRSNLFTTNGNNQEVT